MTNISITYTTQTYQVTPGDPGNEPYRQRGTKQSVHDIEGFEIASRYFDLTVDYEIDPQQVYYLLYVLYSTGDSFGTQRGTIEFIDLYQECDEQIGHDNVRIINGVDNDEPKFRKHKLNDGYTILLYDRHRKLQQTGVAWAGYFESLEDVRLTPVYLLGDNDN